MVSVQNRQAVEVFDEAIKDAVNLLAHFDKLNTKPPSPDMEVLKRAGLIMAMTAWETYVEDRLNQAVTKKLDADPDCRFGDFVRARLGEEIKRLNNPNADKTIQLFKDYVGVDLTDSWCWNNFEFKEVRDQLDSYLKLRGDIVHRARVVSGGPPSAQPVTKASLNKAIAFLKSLVSATEKALKREAN